MNLHPFTAVFLVLGIAFGLMNEYVEVCIAGGLSLLSEFARLYVEASTPEDRP